MEEIAPHDEQMASENKMACLSHTQGYMGSSNWGA